MRNLETKTQEAADAETKYQEAYTAYVKLQGEYVATTETGYTKKKLGEAVVAAVKGFRILKNKALTAKREADYAEKIKANPPVAAKYTPKLYGWEDGVEGESNAGNYSPDFGD